MIGRKEGTRAQWKSNYGFIMAALGSAIGLGNIWRFSYIAYENGGGAFLIPYLIALLSAGIPLLILEFAIGHERTGSTPLAFAKYHKQWEWIGWWAVILIMFGIILYYSVIISWCLNYLKFAFLLEWGQDTGAFFYNDFLGKTSGPFDIGSLRLDIIIGLFIVWLISWFIIYKGVTRGLEIANKIFIPFLIFFITILVVWSITLDGAREGLAAYFIPDFEKLREPKVWLDAYSQVFFSLGLGFGIMITYSSYLPANTNITRSALITAFLDSGFAIFSGIAIFAVLGFMASVSGKEVSEVVSHGIGLAFVAYPQALNVMYDVISPLASGIFGSLFFLSLVIAGLSSAISIIEAFVSAIVDKFLWNRKKVVSIVVTIGFLGGIIFTTGSGVFWIDIVDHFLTSYGVVVVGLLECVVVGWFFRIIILRYHVNKVSTFKLGYWWDFSIRIFVPIILIAIIGASFFKEINEAYGGYASKELIAIGIGWLIVTLMISAALSSLGWQRDIGKHKSRSDDYGQIEDERFNIWTKNMIIFLVIISCFIPFVGMFEGIISYFRHEQKARSLMLIIFSIVSLILWIIFYF